MAKEKKISLKVDEVISVMSESEIEADKIEKAVSKMVQMQMQNADDDENKEKKSYHKVGIAVRGAESLSETPLFVFKQDDTLDPNEVLKDFKRACIEYNQSKKGRRQPVQSFNDALTLVPDKTFRENDVKFVMKREPVIILETDSNILEDLSDLENDDDE